MSDIAVEKPVFSPEAVKSINNAYARALGTLGRESQHSDRRASLAKVIMDLARGGEVDEISLHHRAIAVIRGINRLQVSPETA